MLSTKSDRREEIEADLERTLGAIREQVEASPG